MMPLPELIVSGRLEKVRQLAALAVKVQAAK